LRDDFILWDAPLHYPASNEWLFMVPQTCIRKSNGDLRFFGFLASKLLSIIPLDTKPAIDSSANFYEESKRARYLTGIALFFIE
jgi:hypothetical protein